MINKKKNSFIIEFFPLNYFLDFTYKQITSEVYIVLINPK